MIRRFKNSNFILSLFLFTIMTAYIVFANDFNFTDSILKSAVLILLFVFLYNNYFIIEKLKFKKSSTQNNFSKNNNIDTTVMKSEYNHLHSEIFTNLNNHINNLNPSSFLSIYFIDLKRSSISIKESNNSSFEKKISLDNDIIKEIQKSKKRKIFKKNDNFAGWKKIVNKNDWSGAEILIGYPIIIDAEIIGFSLIYNEHFKDIENRDLKYFDSIINNYVQNMKFLKDFNNLFDDNSFNNRIFDYFKNFKLDIKVENLFKNIGTLFQQYFKYDRLIISICDINHEKLTVIYVDGKKDDIVKGAEFDINNSIYGESVLSNKSIIFNNAEMDINSHTRDKIFPIVSSPVRLNGKAIGSITIERMNYYKFEIHESLKLEKLSIALGKAFEWSNDFKLIENAAIHDGLTSLLNHNAFLNRLDQEIDRCSRFQTNLGLIMLDLDKFKKINDTYGHLYGDFILKEVGKIIKENVRTIDVVGRFGGEEFSVILVNTNVRDCIPLAKRIVEGINRKTFIFDGIATNLTISAGMSGYPSMSKESKELIKMADDAMYQTKKNGGNDVTIFQS